MDHRRIVLDNSSNYLRSYISQIVLGQIDMGDLLVSGEDVGNLLCSCWSKRVLLQYQSPVDTILLAIVTEALGWALSIAISELVHQTFKSSYG